jgi:O-antigen/teichoic acid export membrane protein
MNAVIGFFLVGFFVGHLGENRYGIWVLIGSTFQYRGLLSMGLDSAINRYIPVCLANQDSKGINKVLGTSFYFSLVVSVVLIFLTIVIYWKIGDWFAIQSEFVPIAKLLVLVVGISYSLVVPFQRSTAILSGLQRYDITNIVELSFLLARTLLLVILLRHGYGLLTLGLSFGVSEILMRLVQFFFSNKLLPDNSISIKDIDLRLLKDMVFYGTNTLLYTLAVVILVKASSIVIGIFLGTSQISQFSIATAAVLILSMICQVFSSAIKPAVSDLDARSETGKVREITFLSQKYSLLMLIPASCFLIVMGSDFLRVWVGSTIQDSATLNMMGQILAIFTTAHFVRLTQHSNFLVLVGRGEHKIFGVSMLMTAVSFIVSSVICLKVFRLGLISIAWSNFFPIVIFTGIFLQIYFNKKMQIKFADTIYEVGVPAVLGTLPAVCLILLWKFIAPPSSWLDIAAVVVISAAITLIAGWFFSLSKLERKRFIQIIALKS